MNCVTPGRIGFVGFVLSFPPGRTLHCWTGMARLPLALLMEGTAGRSIHASSSSIRSQKLVRWDVNNFTLALWMSKMGIVRGHSSLFGPGIWKYTRQSHEHLGTVAGSKEKSGVRIFYSDNFRTYCHNHGSGANSVLAACHVFGVKGWQRWQLLWQTFGILSTQAVLVEHRPWNFAGLPCEDAKNHKTSSNHRKPVHLIEWTGILSKQLSIRLGDLHWRREMSKWTNRYGSSCA